MPLPLPDSVPASDREFLAMAARRSLVSPEIARELAAEATTQAVACSQLALERGLLSAVQVEIIETLIRPNETIPGYEILDVLGNGGMGVVYKARQKNLDRIVALKTVLVSKATHPGALARFEQEAITIGRLAHPNIVAAIDFGKHRGKFFLAMELVQGQDLDDFIQKQGRLSEYLAWNLARQAASGLAHAAHQGIVHRDIKPANLLLVKPPEGYPLPADVPMVKITDFGLALLTSEVETRTRLTHDGTTLGSPHYMAPEQFRGSDVDRRADIYALGATVYQMLTGRAPYSGSTLAEIITQKVSGHLPDVRQAHPACSSQSRELLSALMAAHPEDRIGDYGQVLEAIDRLSMLSKADAIKPGRMSAGEIDSITTGISTDPTQSLPSIGVETPATPRADRGMHRRFARRIWLAAVGSLVMLASIGVWLALDRGREITRPTHSAGAWFRPLFDGKSLSGWTPIAGAWSQGKDAEGGSVLVGRGVIRRQFPLPPSGAYRLSANVDLHQASSAELQFALFTTGSGEVNLQYKRLRLDHQGAVLGRGGADSTSQAEFPNYRLSLQPNSSSPGEPHYHELRVELHAAHWLAYVDGILVGSLPRDEPAMRAEFRLLVEGGEAHFDAPTITEMVPMP